MRSLLLTAMCLTVSLTLVACSNQQADSTDHNKEPTIEVPVALLAFTASGNKEKSWRTVVEGNKLSIEAEFLEPTTIVVVGSATTEGVKYESTVNGQPIILNIRKNICIDDNGYQNELTATLSYAGKAYDGCAITGAMETAPT